MASSSSSSIPLLVFTCALLLSSTPSSASRHRRPTFPSHINPLCLRAPYPLLCAQLPAAPTLRSLAELSAKAAASKITTSITVVNKMRSAFASNKRMAATLDVCMEVYSDAVSALNSAAKELHAWNGNMNDVMTDLSASLTDVGTCDDSFDEDPSLFNPVAHISRNLNRLVSNSLALASAVKRGA